MRFPKARSACPGVPFGDRVIGPADDQQRRRHDARERLLREIRPAAPRDDRTHDARAGGGRDERDGSPRARAEVPDGELSRLRMAAHVVRGAGEPAREEGDVEPQRAAGDAVFLLFLGRQQVEQQRGQTSVRELGGHETVAGARPRRRGSVGEEHDPACAGRNREIARECDVTGGDLGRPREPRSSCHSTSPLPRVPSAARSSPCRHAFCRNGARAPRTQTACVDDPRQYGLGRDVSACNPPGRVARDSRPVSSETGLARSSEAPAPQDRPRSGRLAGSPDTGVRPRRRMAITARGAYRGGAGGTRHGRVETVLLRDRSL